MIDYDLSNYIAADVPIASVVNGRVWANKQPDMENLLFPSILVFRVSTVPVYDMNGASGLAQARFEVVCMDSSFKQARDLSDLVRQRLAGFRGTMGSTTVDSVMLEDDADFLNMRNNAKATFYAVSQDYDVHYRET